MNFNSPSDELKNIERFFDSESPCVNPKHFRKESRVSRLAPLATRNLNLLDIDSNFDSPTSTLAADLSENFHIAEINQQFKPQKQISKRPSLFSKMDSFQSSRPSLHTDSSRSSRATSNASISSACSFSSFSSIDSTSSSNLFPSQKSPSHQLSASASTSTINSTTFSKNTLRRAMTTTASTSLRSLQSAASFSFVSKVDLNNDDDDSGDFLDKFCVPSPINERTLTLDDDDDEENESSSLELNKREIGSPIQKKPLRSKVRRIHSMFYSKKEITDTTNMFGNLMNSKSPNLDKILDGTEDNEDENLSNSVLHKSKIETFNVKNDSIPRINVNTLCEILDGQYREFFDEVVVIDCRFEYEYKGGHINGALNVSSQRELEEQFLENSRKNNFESKNKKKLIIFHCEFSSYRGPLMAAHLRTCDRNINQDNYPHLDYPDILILEGGYKTFFDSQSLRCYPQKYVEMNDNNHKTLCEKELTRFKRDLKRAGSFNNLSFAASVNSSSTSLTNTSNITNGHRLHRSVTSSVINFSKRPSLKSQSLDFTRSSIDIYKVDENDENRPPASLNFAFKFPKPIEQSNNSDSIEMKPPSSTLQTKATTNITSSRFAAPQRPHNDTPIVRKKLTRSFTYNM